MKYLFYEYGSQKKQWFTLHVKQLLYQQKTSGHRFHPEGHLDILVCLWVLYTLGTLPQFPILVCLWVLYTLGTLPQFPVS